MRILVQWARASGSDWEEFDSDDWAALPVRTRPGPVSAVDSHAGWINAVNVQGVIFSGDSVAVEPIGGSGVRVTQMNDDPKDWPGRRHMRVVDILPIGPDPELNGAINTRMFQTVYGESAFAARLRGITVQPWGDRPRVAEALCRHGISMPDGLYATHVAAQTPHGWREWTEHLPSIEKRSDGRLRPQRALGRYIVPDGTRTYYHLLSALAIGGVAATNENALGLAPSTAQNQVSGNVGSNATIEWAAASPVGEPNNAAWPTGDYRAQLDVPTTSSDLQFGFLTLDTNNGGFCRFSSDLASILETIPQQEAAFSLSGLHLATTGSVSWAAGAAADRFGILLAAERVSGHGTSTLTLQLGELDDFTDGPWPAAPGPPENGLLFGANF